jgi:hypothetical protein
LADATAAAPNESQRLTDKYFVSIRPCVYLDRKRVAFANFEGSFDLAVCGPKRDKLQLIFMIVVIRTAKCITNLSCLRDSCAVCSGVRIIAETTRCAASDNLLTILFQKTSA